MADKITYYAVIGGDRTIDSPYGLVRHVESEGEGYTDEALRKDFGWHFTPVIVEWRRGDFADELIEVSHEQADKIIEYFRGAWGQRGQPVES
jgi:hypothetical protein